MQMKCNTKLFALQSTQSINNRSNIERTPEVLFCKSSTQCAFHFTFHSGTFVFSAVQQKRTHYNVNWFDEFPMIFTILPFYLKGLKFNYWFPMLLCICCFVCTIDDLTCHDFWMMSQCTQNYLASSTIVISTIKQDLNNEPFDFCLLDKTASLTSIHCFWMHTALHYINRGTELPTLCIRKMGTSKLNAFVMRPDGNEHRSSELKIDVESKYEKMVKIQTNQPWFGLPTYHINFTFDSIQKERAENIRFQQNATVASVINFVPSFQLNWFVCVS